jgi:hypothetical protein
MFHEDIALLEVVGRGEMVFGLFERRREAFNGNDSEYGS